MHLCKLYKGNKVFIFKVYTFLEVGGGGQNFDTVYLFLLSVDQSKWMTKQIFHLPVMASADELTELSESKNDF